MNKLMEIAAVRRVKTHQKEPKILGMNNYTRRAENERIVRENERFAQRLFGQRPHI